MILRSLLFTGYTSDRLRWVRNGLMRERDEGEEGDDLDPTDRA